MLAWFRALMPKEERFFPLFAKQSELLVAGINLPMLIKLASVRDEEGLGDAVLHAQEAGRKYINVASRVLAGK